MVENRKHFIDELSELHNRVCSMANEVLESFKRLVIACEDRDLELAQHIVEHDKIINGLEESINVDAYLLIAKQCPVASDLRGIISALKISNELERIADYASNVAKYLIHSGAEEDYFIERIVKLNNVFIPMFKNIMKSYKEHDVELALETPDMDEDLDKMYNGFVQEFIKVAKDKTDQQAEEALRVILILKQIERAGDHVTNIAEQIVYMLNGKLIELD
jgi:phosphate transport system protein